jgi:hypothetical protein
MKDQAVGLNHYLWTQFGIFCKEGQIVLFPWGDTAYRINYIFCATGVICTDKTDLSTVQKSQKASTCAREVECVADCKLIWVYRLCQLDELRDIFQCTRSLLAKPPQYCAKFGTREKIYRSETRIYSNFTTLALWILSSLPSGSEIQQILTFRRLFLHEVSSEIIQVTSVQFSS